MMHPDQIYSVRQLRHHDLRVEVEQARASRELVGNRTVGVCARLVVWIRRLGKRRLGVSPVSGTMIAEHVSKSS